MYFNTKNTLKNNSNHTSIELQGPYLDHLKITKLIFKIMIHRLYIYEIHLDH